jgi:hypothetical protein
MFWRRHYCYDCYRHHEWLTFRRGMAAMFILAFAVLGLLDYPHSHHVHRPHASHARALTSRHHQQHHKHRRHVPDHRAHPQPERTTTPHAARHIRPTGRRHSPSGNTGLATADQGLSWTDFHGIPLPLSATSGPRHRNRGLASGFADTPRGALLAAVNIAVRTAAEWGPAIFQPTIASQVTGRNADALLRADIRAYAEARASGAPSSLSTAVEEAYRFVAYATTAATIDLVTSGPSANGTPVLVVTKLRVVWLRGDWRLVAPPSGNWARAAAPISSLAGYTIFPSAG